MGDATQNKCNYFRGLATFSWNLSDFANGQFEIGPRGFLENLLI